MDYPVIDSDGHVYEPADLWQRYMPAELHDRAPRRLPRPGNVYLSIDGVETPPPGRYGKTTKKLPLMEDERYKRAKAEGYSAETQVEACDIEGIDASVLFPSIAITVMGVDGVDPKITTAAVHAYNTWLAEFCAKGCGRLFGIGMVDPRDVKGAVVEAKRAINELGFVGIGLRPNPLPGQPWHSPAYDPLWAAVEALDVPVCFHEGAAVRLPQVAVDRFEEHAMWHMCTHPMENQMAMVSIILGGVAERFPKLRFGFMECGAGWLPYWMWRMGEAIEGDNYHNVPLEPAEYVERQCFVSIDSDEHTGVFTIEQMKHPRVVWGTDYPHHDAKFPNALKTVSTLPGMTPERAKSVLHDAPLQLFGPKLAAQVRKREAVTAK